MSPSHPTTPFQQLLAALSISWWIAGLRLLRRAPLRLAVVSVLPLFVEAAIQCVPQVGVLLSKVLTPMLGAGAFVVLDRVQRSEPWRWLDCLAGFSSALRRRTFLACLLMTVVFWFQLATVVAIYGQHAFDFVLFRTDAPELMTMRFVLTLIIPGMLLVATPLMFTLPLVVLRSAAPVSAMVGSLRAAWQQRVSVAAYGLITCMVIVSGLLLNPLLLLILVPWVMTSHFAAYQAVFEATGQPVQ